LAKHSPERESIVSTLAILRLPAVKARVAFGRSTIYELIKRGDFPKPRRISSRAVGWDSREIDAWIEEHLASSPVAKPTRSEEMRNLAARRKATQPAPAEA
jgi:prophage regulatory protein